MQNRDFMEKVFPFWEGLLQTQKELLQASVKEKTFSKGEVLCYGAEDCMGLLLVKSGRLRAFIISESGREITLYRLLDGDVCFFSAACVIKNIDFEVHLEVEKDTAAFLVPVQVYESLMQSSLQVAGYTNQLMASRFSEVMWIMEKVLFTSFDSRLASFLREQSKMEESDVLNTTHEEIARHMGSAREVVTRMLKYFQTEGIVKLSRGRITILDGEKLEKLVK